MQAWYAFQLVVVCCLHYCLAGGTEECLVHVLELLVLVGESIQVARCVCYTCTLSSLAWDVKIQSFHPVGRRNWVDRKLPHSRSLVASSGQYVGLAPVWESAGMVCLVVGYCLRLHYCLARRTEECLVHVLELLVLVGESIQVVCCVCYTCTLSSLAWDVKIKSFHPVGRRNWVDWQLPHSRSFVASS